jgi:hypothetical protein
MGNDNQPEAQRKSLREQVGMEHRIARSLGLGIHRSRYLRRKKTCFQVLMAAVVVNSSLLVGLRRQWAQQVGGTVEKASADLGGGPQWGA